MWAVDDLEDLRPVVREVPGAPKHAKFHERFKPPPGARRRPSEPYCHELYDRPFPGHTVREMHLNRGRHEGELFALRRIPDVPKHGPQSSDPSHVRPIEDLSPVPSACT